VDKKDIKETIKEKKSEKKSGKKVIVAAVAVIVVAAAAFGAWYFTGNTPETTQNNTTTFSTETVNANQEQLAEKVDISADTTENLVPEEEVLSGGTTQDVVEELPGNNSGAVMTVNGEPVGASTYSMVLNDRAMKYATSLLVSGALENISKFDWNAKDPHYDGTYLDYVKYSAVEYIVPRYALVAEGKRRGVVLTEDDKKQVQDGINELREGLSDEEFVQQLAAMGCPSEEVLTEFREFTMLEQKVQADFESNPEKYVSKEQLETGSIEDYFALLNHNAKVVLNNSVFEPMKVTVDIDAYITYLMDTMQSMPEQK